MDKAEIAKLFARMRKKSGLNQTEFAREIGVTQSNISKIESGNSDPRLSVYFRAREALRRLRRTETLQ